MENWYRRNEKYFRYWVENAGYSWDPDICADVITEMWSKKDYIIKKDSYFFVAYRNNYLSKKYRDKLFEYFDTQENEQYFLLESSLAVLSEKFQEDDLMIFEAYYRELVSMATLAEELNLQEWYIAYRIKQMIKYLKLFIKKGGTL